MAVARIGYANNKKKTICGKDRRLFNWTDTTDSSIRKSILCMVIMYSFFLELIQNHTWCLQAYTMEKFVLTTCKKKKILISYIK